MSYWLAHRVARTRFIAMPNILFNQEVVPEFRQSGLTEDRLEMVSLACDPLQEFSLRCGGAR